MHTVETTHHTQFFSLKIIVSKLLNDIDDVLQNGDKGVLLYVVFLVTSERSGIQPHVPVRQRHVREVEIGHVVRDTVAMKEGLQVFGLGPVAVAVESCHTLRRAGPSHVQVCTTTQCITVGYHIGELHNY